MGFWTDIISGHSEKPVTAGVSIAEPAQLRSTSRQYRNIAEAWQVWRQVGEIHYAVNQQARLMSRIDWDILINGTLQEPEQRDEILSGTFGSSTRDLARKATTHLLVAGGFFLARFNDTDWLIYPDPPSQSQRKLLESADILVSVTDDDPLDSTKTDSSVIASLDVARELILRRGQSRAAARSRTAQLQTVLYPIEAVNDPDEFERSMTDVMTAPIQDERSTASVVPNLIGFRGDWIEKWRTIDLTGDVEEGLQDKITALIRQLATMMDIPPELMTGMGDTNHWSQWAIQEDNWLGHVEPIAKLIAGAFAEAIGAASGMTDGRVTAEPDPTVLMQRRPELGDALKAYEIGLVSGEWAREQLGADEDDAGTGEPLRQAVGPQVAAADTSDPPVDVSTLAMIDKQLVDSLEDLITDARDRAMERVGARARSRLQGTSRRADLANISNRDLPAMLGADNLENVDALVQETVQDMFDQKLDRIVDRAVTDTRQAGIDISVDDSGRRDTVNLLVSRTVEIVSTMINGEPVDALIWGTAKRAAAVLGGDTDPGPVVAAKHKGLKALGGIALGVAALAFVKKRFGKTPDRYKWVHRYVGPHPHPMHESFDGRIFDGVTLDNHDGVEWYPGDHAGCRCGGVPAGWKG